MVVFLKCSHGSDSRGGVGWVVVFKTHYCCRHGVKLVVGDSGVGLTVSLLETDWL